MLFRFQKKEQFLFFEFKHCSFKYFDEDSEIFLKHSYKKLNNPVIWKCELNKFGNVNPYQQFINYVYTKFNETNNLFEKIIKIIMQKKTIYSYFRFCRIFQS